MLKPLHQFARPAIFKSLLATGLVALSIFYWSCQKEPFNQNPATKTGAEVPTATISIEAAQAYFQTHASTVSSAVDDEAIRFVRMMPDWDHVQLDTALSGRQMLVVPLLDQTLSNLNQGRSGATLLFSQNGPDTITADVLVFIADSVYYEQNNHTINFNNFTGVFLFLDLSQRFKFGVAVRNGVPVGPATEVSAVNVNVADDREGGINYEDCVERQMHFWVECNAMASGECNTWVWITYLDCSGVIPGGTGNGWGNPNSYGGGGGSGSLILTPEEINNWGWIEHLIVSGQLNFYAAYALGVPVHIFV
ncbi:MAG: hypothetical protein JNJ57_09035, partial [Saprospiraceae bacterium]|nr:hypothetical protein [Saprospiraceae bacterium]